MSAKDGTQELTDQISARVPESLMRRARMAAARENKNVSQWLRDFLDRELPEE